MPVVRINRHYLGHSPQDDLGSDEEWAESLCQKIGHTSLPSRRTDDMVPIRKAALTSAHELNRGEIS